MCVCVCVCRRRSDCDALVLVSGMLCFIIIVINNNTATEPFMLSVAENKMESKNVLESISLEKMSGAGRSSSEELIPS